MATQDDRIVGFNLCNYDEAGEVLYIGSTRHDGSTLIQRFVEGEMLYFLGLESYSVLWANRATHEYKLFHEVF